MDLKDKIQFEIRSKTLYLQLKNRNKMKLFYFAKTKCFCVGVFCQLAITVISS